MATSGTTAFRPTVEEIISESYERCGIDPQTRTGHHATSARRSLNLLFSEWANRGINYWTVGTATLNTDLIAQDSPEGDITLPAEFSLQNGNELVLLDLPLENQKIIVIRRQGKIWNDTGKTLSNSDTDIARFLRSTKVDLPR